jgi:hypothetical protein
LKIKLVDFDCKSQQFKIQKLKNYLSISNYVDSNDRKIKKYEFGDLLTNAEKSWLFEEIKEQISQKE